mgnify:CR=1 FL=1
MNGRTINPVAETERFQVLDLLRGFALCGILLANIVAMGQPWARAYPAFPAELTSPDWAAWTLQALFVEGSMRALFTLLFGAGVVLLTAWGARADRPAPEDTRGPACVWFLPSALVVQHHRTQPTLYSAGQPFLRRLRVVGDHKGRYGPGGMGGAWNCVTVRSCTGKDRVGGDDRGALRLYHCVSVG